jgi:hypothetical protein
MYPVILSSRRRPAALAMMQRAKCSRCAAARVAVSIGAAAMVVMAAVVPTPTPTPTVSPAVAE